MALVNCLFFHFVHVSMITKWISNVLSLIIISRMHTNFMLLRPEPLYTYTYINLISLVIQNRHSIVCRCVLQFNSVYVLFPYKRFAKCIRLHWIVDAAFVLRCYVNCNAMTNSICTPKKSSFHSFADRSQIDLCCWNVIWKLDCTCDYWLCGKNIDLSNENREWLWNFSLIACYRYIIIIYFSISSCRHFELSISRLFVAICHCIEPSTQNRKRWSASKPTKKKREKYQWNGME